mgnify:CR=1 FL=1
MFRRFFNAGRYAAIKKSPTQMRLLWALSKNMKKYSLSFAIGILSFGWLSLVYEYLFDYLYIFISFVEKVQYCKGILNSDVCHGVAYAGLWISELPLLLVSFTLFFLAVTLLAKRFSIHSFEWQFVIFGYFLSFVLLIAYSEYGITFYGLLCGLYQALIAVLVMCVVSCLTRRST